MCARLFSLPFLFSGLFPAPGNPPFLCYNFTMDQEPKHQVKVFSVQEANALVPFLTDAIFKLQEKRRNILALEVEIDATELVVEKDDGGSAPALSKKVDEYTRSVSSFYTQLEEVHAKGCFLKDLDAGLVDFYGKQQGRVVYLCWKLGETKVGHWHEVGKGFASREVLDPKS